MEDAFEDAILATIGAGIAAYLSVNAFVPTPDKPIPDPLVLSSMTVLGGAIGGSVRRILESFMD